MSLNSVFLTCFLVVARVDARSLRATEARQIGAELAEALKSTSASLSAQEDPDEFQKSLFADLMSNQDVLVHRS